MVHRLYVEKRENREAAGLLQDLRSFVGIERLTGLRCLNRYDMEHIDEALLAACIGTVFSEPPLDEVYAELPVTNGIIFAVESLPGQFDQRADSAAQCVQLVSLGERPLVRAARVYLLEGALTAEDIAAVKRYVINPVESREADLSLPETLALLTDAPPPVPTLTGFLTADPDALRAEYGLAMDAADVRFCQQYFATEHRDPTLTELRMIDTYWSDHCRHTTFLTEITAAAFDHPEAEAAYQDYLRIRAELGSKKPITLMDLATIGAKYLKKIGRLTDLDESEEINACTVRIEATIDGKSEPWLLLFKNETHNHPTEIEPFGGAATCIGGAIRDPLSGRAYVYQAMRVTGAANPLRPVAETIPGKLPQRKLTTTAAAGYSAYGNQIGLATGLVDEIYHEGYAAKRLEIGAVVGATPAAHVRREVPDPGDVVVLLGGRTGRDGCGGATGSSKSHTAASLLTCGAEVQKGNAPEERKLQRLFRNPEAARRIKRCNDFGAGGVSVAIGELADGLEIDLDAVPKKYEGLSGTELAISESQERMAVVLAPEDVADFLALAAAENLEATEVARVTEAPRLVMRWQGAEIVNIARSFLNSNGAPKAAAAKVAAPDAAPIPRAKTFAALAEDLNVCSKRGLSERFDATIGAGTVLMPFGGRYQMTPPQAMVALLPTEKGETDTASAMAYGFDPFISERDPYRGAYWAVVESVARLVATGAGYKAAHLTFQEYFERMQGENSWGKPLAALLGALRAQLDLGLAAIGGKDSMSGTFERLHVPPTLVSFAVTTAKAGDIISPEFKRAGSPLRLLPMDNMIETFDAVTALIQAGQVRAAYAVGQGGIAEALLKMSLGNRIGVAISDDTMDPFAPMPGAFLLETDAPVGMLLGMTTAEWTITGQGEMVNLAEMQRLWEAKLEPVFPTNTADSPALARTFTSLAQPPRRAAQAVAKPRVLIPVFPGTNCEYDSARAFERAGGEAEIFVVQNLSSRAVEQSAARFAERLSQAQILFLPGGFSGGDEPDGSAKFIAAFLRSPRVADALQGLLTQRDGLVGGICNGFQALIKLGLLPFGELRDADAHAPTLTYNRIGRHQSRLVRTRVASNRSPWLMLSQPGDIHLAPISHGEGRFVCAPDLLNTLAENGQIATQYVDLDGQATMDILCNPNGSAEAVEGLLSADGRVFGRMAHSERSGKYLYKNVPGDGDSPMFRGAICYYR
ncbi:MAG: phosphoribosylformylglycinamidine synthase [Oscillospiraceae bacterium]|jgi:phosphoribosylformylglycinamidine synthase|nr:phosphoribosylformylglycinamidine synthase [Oscillospiraceae bacterium]